MWAVYLCGCTDCFLHALFMDEQEARAWAASKAWPWPHTDRKDPEAPIVKYWARPEDIDRSDTGWYIPSNPEVA